MNEKMEDGNDDNPEFRDSLTTASESPVKPDQSTAGQTGSLSEVTSFPEQISTEDTELSDISVNVSQDASVKGAATGGVSICSPRSVEDQPKPPRAPPPSSVEACTVYEVSQSFASISKSRESLKPTTVHTEPDGDDLCAAVLLACLFCHPLDCFLATVSGCNACLWSLCSSLCGCAPDTLRPLLDVTQLCDLCGCPDARCCDICLQATECLDLAMEISQMLYH